MMFNKRGKQSIAVMAIGVILAAYLIVFVVLAAFSFKSTHSMNFEYAKDKIVDFTEKIVGPFFSFLLGLQGNTGNQKFLIVLSFVLMMIIIVGTLDSVKIFDIGDTGSNYMNLLIGIIISVIGVRFMPDNMWEALTAPSSALVATVLVGLPFFALFFISMKMTSAFASKMLWMFYLVFMSYLVYKASEQIFWVYVIFLCLAGILLVFDGTARRYWKKMQGERDMTNIAADIGLKDRAIIRAEIKKYYDVLADPSASDADRSAAQRKINRLKKLYGDLSSF